MIDEVRAELINHIIPFWNALEDNENGGFYGFMDNKLNLDKNADKGTILHARILWFYSNAYLVLKDEICLDKAKTAYDFLVKHCIDKKNGGVYWLVDAKGKPVDTMKHIYCQAFFVYALSSYYEASGDKYALNLATDMFQLIEEKGRDDIAYKEAMTCGWQEAENEALSENGIKTEKTMNTILHLIEAYTELYRVSSDNNVQKVLVFLLDLIYTKVYDRDNKKLFVFFDKDMKVLGDIHSYGHDIEATWLIDRACEVILSKTSDKEEMKKKLARLSDMNKAIVKNIAEIAFENGSLNEERDGEHISRKRIWWVQAEGVVGFLQAFANNPDIIINGYNYYRTTEKLWEYIRDNIVDKRNGGEWYSYLNEDGSIGEKPVVERWKCPYHNGRMCLEVIKRNVLV